MANIAIMILFIWMTMCVGQKPYSLSYTQKYCMATALGSNGPRCFCVAECRNYTLQYQSVPVYRVSKDCDFYGLYQNGGYTCMCKEPDNLVECLDNKYQFFEY